MEVHAHTHTARKKWTHYFWEFLMLFLAVFCGFLAENQREHYVEHQREKEFMITMLEDLKSDTVLLNATIKDWAFVNKSIDSVADAIQLPVANTDFIKIYRHLNNALNYWSFRYNDRTIAQLKNSGAFRLIRKKEVANKIVAYDQLNSDAIVIIKDQRNSFYEMVVGLRNKIFDQQIISSIRNRFGIKPIPVSENPVIDSLLSKSKIPLSQESQAVLLFEFRNAILAYRTDYRNLEWGHNATGKAIEELISLIKKEYHLK